MEPGQSLTVQVRYQKPVSGGQQIGVLHVETNDPRFSAAEKCALRYAERMYLAPQSIDAAFYADMKQHFSEAQIMELGAFIAFHYGMQAFARTLGMPAESP